MEDWRGYAADGRTDSSRSSLLDGGASDVASYTQRAAAAADSLYFSQQQQLQQQHMQQQQQQYVQCLQQPVFNSQQQQGYRSQDGAGMPQPQQTIEVANYVEREQQREREIARKQQTALRRGLFSVTELEDWMGEDCPQLDRQALIRFPPEVAETLRQRLHNAAAAGAAAPDGGDAGGAALGLTITPRPDYNYRSFDVKLSGYRGRLRGILMELPTLIETYKSVDSDILFKSGDVCQMLYVFDPQVNNLDLGHLCDKQQWEWQAGLTPPTHRIRSRKFKNIDLFDREEIRDAELEVLQLLHGLRRDTYELEVHTELEMLDARKEQEREQQQQQQQSKPSASSSSTPSQARVERVVLTTEDVNELLNQVDQDDEYLSDASDILFSIQSDTTSVAGADSLVRPRRGRGGGAGGLSRLAAAPSRVRQEAETPQVGGLVVPNSQQIQQQQHAQQTLLLQHHVQQQLQGISADAVPMPEQNDAEERERLRLRKEKRKQKKDRKRARREQKLQQQQQQQQLEAGVSSALTDDIAGQGNVHGALMAPTPSQEPPAALGEGALAAHEGNEDADDDGLSSLGSADGQ